MSELEFLGMPQSTYTRAVCMAAIEKGLDYSLTLAMPHSEPIYAVSPVGRVPVMRHGDVEMCESRAILDYMESQFGGASLIPSDPVEHAEMEKWISLVNTAFDETMIRQYLFGYIFPKTDDKRPDREQIDQAAEDMAPQIAALEKRLSTSAYLAGDSLTIADLNLAPILAYIREMPEVAKLFDKAPALSAYFARLQERQSFKDTVPPPPSSA